MPIKVTRNWSTQRLSWKVPWTAHVDFDVTGVADESAALVAINADDPSVHIFQLSESLDIPGASRLKCTGPEIINKKGPGYYVVGCDFEIPTTGEFPAQPEDPLDQPVDIDWQLVSATVPVDVDLDGRPIVYKNGEPITGATREVQWYRLSLYKNMPWFDFSLSQTYSNTTNDAAVSLAGNPAAVEHMKCCAVIPAARYKATAEFVPMGFHFEIFFDDALGTYPFQHRFLNQGSYGHWSDGGTIRRALFSDGVQHAPANKGELLNRMVRLNLTGLPTGPDTFAKVGPDNASAVQLTTVPATYQTETLTDAFALIYKKTRLVPFAPLLAIL